MKLESADRKTTGEDGQESHPSTEEAVCGYFAGALCPKCKQGILDYNGMLNLQCPLCGLENGYGFT